MEAGRDKALVLLSDHGQIGKEEMGGAGRKADPKHDDSVPTRKPPDINLARNISFTT
jgi:hypothetical protein